MSNLMASKGYHKIIELIFVDINELYICLIHEYIHCFKYKFLWPLFAISLFIITIGVDDFLL